MITLIYSVCDIRYTAAVTDYGNVGCTVAQFVYHICERSLTQCTDDTGAGHHDFISFLICTEHAFFGYLQTTVLGVYGYQLIDFLQHQRTMAYVCIGSQFLTQFNQMHLFAFLCKMDCDFTSGQTAAQNNHLISYLFRCKIVVIYQGDLLAASAFSVDGYYQVLLFWRKCCRLFVSLFFICEIRVGREYNSQSFLPVVICHCEEIYFANIMIIIVYLWVLLIIGKKIRS